MSGSFFSTVLLSFAGHGRQNTLFMILLLLAALISGQIAMVAWKRRRIGPVASAVALFMLASCWWGLTYAFHWSGALEPSNMFWLDTTYLGVVIVPTAYLAFALYFTGHGNWLTKRKIAILAIEPVLTLILLWTDSFHHLFFGGTQFTNGTAILSGGPGFWLNIVYSYLMILIAFGFLARFAVTTTGTHRKQAVLILTGSLIPWASSAISVLDISPVPGLDLTPFAFTLTGLVFAFALFRLNLLKIVPVARGALVEVMSDGFFVTDLNNHVVDINLAAQEFLGITKASIGKNAEVLFRNTPELVESYRDVAEGQYEVFTEYYGQRYLDMRVVPLYDSRNEYTGRLYIFRDITERKTVENEVREANIRLKEQLSEIENLQEELRMQAIRDPLTALYNRRYLEESLEKELSRARREGTPVSILMLDIDHFKVFNDTFGHRVGDAVLRALGELLLQHTRNGGDIACRYGGEEFVIVLTGTTLENASHRAEQFRIAFEEMRVTVGGAELSATASIGVAAFPLHGSTGEAVLHAADQALYQAKETGRNRVVVWEKEDTGG
ncbi:MAG: diguanylate cyclase [Candidatus Sabulitectum sp.]|nr:diguanylate cyclase [Candidatus Sabulitectum sp.]